jgi:hypothetical protein
MVKYIGSGGFASTYSALWMEGPRWIWDDGAQEWTRRAGLMNVALKLLNNSLNISSSYIDQVCANYDTINCLRSEWNYIYIYIYIYIYFNRLKHITSAYNQLL